MDTLRDVTVLHEQDGLPWCQFLIKSFEKQSSDITVHSVDVAMMAYENPPEIEVSVRQSYVLILLVTCDFIEYMENNKEWFVGMLEKHNNDITTIFAAMLCVDYSDCIKTCNEMNYCYTSWKFIEINPDGSNIKDVVMKSVKMRELNMDNDKKLKDAEKQNTELSVCQMFPSKVRMDQDDIAIVFLEEVEGEVTVLFDGTDDPVTTIQLNPYCVSFTPPVMPAGSHTVHILLDKIEIEILQLVYYNVEITSLDLMKQFFGVTTTKQLDNVLSSQYCNSICTDETLNTLVNLAESQQDIATDTDYPTALHWSAAHGLENLASQLLMSPFGVSISQIQNCHGETVSDLAEREGHYNLKQYIDDFLDTMECENVYEHTLYNLARAGKQDTKHVPDVDTDIYIQASADNDDDYIVPDVQNLRASRGSDTYEEMSADPLDQHVTSHRDECYEQMSLDPLVQNASQSAEPRWNTNTIHSGLQTTRGMETLKDNEFNSDEIYEQMSEDPFVKPHSPAPPVPYRDRTHSDLTPTKKRTPKQPPPVPYRDRTQSDTVLKAGAVGCRSQNELIDIQDEVKNGNFTIDEAQMLFSSWKERYHRGNFPTSFRDKKKLMDNTRTQYKEALSVLGQANKETWLHEKGIRHKPVISDPIIPRKGNIGSTYRREEQRISDRSSSSSHNSGDMSFRRSNDSGCDVHLFDNESMNTMTTAIVSPLVDQCQSLVIVPEHEKERPPLPPRQTKKTSVKIYKKPK